MTIEFSIIIPTYNRPDGIRACLNGVAALSTRRAVEVIVVNDGGAPLPEGAGDAVRRRFRLTVVEQPNAGPAAARNHGVAHAQGTMLAFLDDDCVPRPDWLDELALALAPAPGQVVGGRVVNGLPENPYASASQVLLHFLYAYYFGGGGERGQLPFLTTNNLALATDTWRAVGGLDASMRWGEDRELSARLARAGYCLQFAPRAVVEHRHALTLRTFVALHARYGRGAFLYRARVRSGAPWSGMGSSSTPQLHSTPQLQRLRREPFRFYAGMLSWPWRERKWVSAARESALIALSEVAYAWGYLAARRQDGAAPARDISRPEESN